VIGVVHSVICDGHLIPPEIRGHDRLVVVDLLQDALVLAPRRLSGCPTEDQHDSTIFLEEFVMLDVLSDTGFGRVLWLVLPTEITLHEVAVLQGVLDRTLMVRVRYLEHLLEVIPWGTSLWLGRQLVGYRHKVVAVELAIFLLMLLWPGDWSLTLFLLGLPPVESDGLLPMSVVSGQVKEFLNGLRLDSPYPVDKGPARGTILESCDDLVVGRIGELGVALGEAAYVVAETLLLLPPTMVKLAGIAGPGVGALEMPYEAISKLSLAIDPSQGEVLEPGTC
jgi:hypothetical protein